jgi:hypothetical protein
VVGVEQWAGVRRMERVEGLSAREIGRRTGLARDTVSRLLAADAPPRYSRAPAGSILDPFKEWVCEQLQADPKVPSQRLREMAVEIGYAGGKTIFDAYVREVRPRFLVKRTIYRPAELIQCDLWEPSRHVPVGYGQTRRVKRWLDGDMRKRWTAASILVAEQQFHRIALYADLAKLVIAIERHTSHRPKEPGPQPPGLKDPDRQKITEPVTV